ncbi:riboflavin synthase subunit alpha [Dissulfurispira thermophila]|uniref:Riboflavin synthase n=1 Tax=Dissulfurispira thermophila TaxID=2715679 RepID=A0A7G1GYK7_9BACT|nr:riboflavin synthase [Dissulfurispira thermophila]BCB95142.1 riboflavin synthase subunit alpha [Dissulfurispira thermophila]
MFTGLIIELGEVVSLEKKTESARLFIKSSDVIKDAVIGDSIAINGVCLTVVSIDKDIFSFDVSHETLKSTNLGSLRRGDRVNLEPSLRPNSKLGGHFVTGHVEGTGRIKSKTHIGNAIRVEIQAPDNILRYLIEKGSVTVDGISLTVVDVLKDAFNVVIIPHTAKMTTIGFKNIGDTVNLEPDILGKYVAKFLSNSLLMTHGSQSKNQDSGLLSALKKSGFIADNKQ